MVARVTTDESAEDRGRLPAHTITAVRRRKRMIARRRHTIMMHSIILSESDTDSDDEELRDHLWQQQRRQFKVLSRNALSYMMSCRPRIEFADPPMMDPFEMSEYQLELNTRQSKDMFEFYLSAQGLTLLPRMIVTAQGCKSTRSRN